MASNREQSAIDGALIGSALGPVGTIPGAIFGFFLGAAKDAEEAEQDNRDNLRAIEFESNRFQANARAQRLSLLTEGRRFSEDNRSDSIGTSAVSPAVDNTTQPITSSKNPLSSGTF